MFDSGHYQSQCRLIIQGDGEITVGICWSNSSAGRKLSESKTNHYIRTTSITHVDDLDENRMETTRILD